MKIAILCCGLENYSTNVLQEGESPLKFTVSTALSLSQQLPLLWNNAEIHTETLLNDELSLQCLAACSARLATLGPFDVFIFSYSGHGRPNALLFNVAGESGLINAKELHHVLSSVDRGKFVALIDCCFSETFARSLSEHVGAEDLILASTGSNSNAWEDNTLSLTSFGHALIQQLSLHKNTGASFFTDRFKEISAQTTLYTYALKRDQRQEPKLISHSSTTLQELSIFEVLRSRFKQISTAIAFALLAVMAFVFFATYRFEVDSTGRIVAKYGPQFLSFANIGQFDTRLETRYFVNSLKQGADSDGLTNGEIWGVWARKNAAGHPDWLAKLIPLLADQLRPSLLFSVGRIPDFASEEIAPFDFTLILSLHGEDSLGRDTVDNYLNASYRPASSGCGDEDAAYNAPGFSAGAMQNRINSLAFYNYITTLSSWMTEERLIDLVRQAENRSMNFNQREGHALLEIFDAYRARELLDGSESLTASLEQKLLETGSQSPSCEALANTILARLSLGDAMTLEEYFWESFYEIDEMQREFELGNSQYSEDEDSDIMISPTFGLFSLNREGRLSGWSQSNLESEDFIYGFERDVVVSAGKLPEQTIEDWIYAVEQEAEYENFSSPIMQNYMLLLTRQTFFLSEAQVNRLVAVMQALEGWYAANQGMFAQDSEAIKFGKRERDRLWALLALGGQLPNEVQARLSYPELSYQNWLQELGLNDPMIPYSRLPMGIVATNVARLGLRHSLPERSYESLQTYALDLAANRIQYPPQYYDNIMGVLPKLDDISNQTGTLLLALGRPLYTGMDSREFSDVVLTRIAATTRKPIQDLELQIASTWLSSFPLEDQDAALEHFRSHWKDTESTDMKINLAQLISSIVAQRTNYLLPDRSVIAH